MDDLVLANEEKCIDASLEAYFLELIRLPEGRLIIGESFVAGNMSINELASACQISTQAVEACVRLYARALADGKAIIHD